MKSRKELEEIEESLFAAITSLTYPEKVVWAICGAIWAIRVMLEKPIADGEMNLSGIDNVMKTVKKQAARKNDCSRN